MQIEVDGHKEYGFIEVVPENEGLASKLLRKSKQELSGKRYGIGALVDTDVFFALMAHYFQTPLAGLNSSSLLQIVALSCCKGRKSLPRPSPSPTTTLGLTLL